VRAAGVAALILAIGCSERQTPADTKAPAAATTQTPTPPPGAPIASGARAAAHARKPLPAPVAMPGGGFRIDMRGTNWHVRALERQADGTFKHVCTDAPDLQPPGSAP
jgi:hypothetical protein